MQDTSLVMKRHEHKSRVYCSRYRYVVNSTRRWARKAIKGKQYTLCFDISCYKRLLIGIFLNDSHRSFAELLEVVADVRRQLRHLAGEMNTIPEAWGSPLQLIAMLMQTNLSLNLSLPFSYHFVTAAGSLLHHHAPAQRRRFVSAVDKKILASVDFALTTLASSEGLGLSTEQLQQTIAEAMANIEATVNQQPKLFVAAKLPQRNGSTTNNNNNNNSTVEALTAAGNLEKVSVFLDYLSEKHENAAVKFGEKKNLLRSDVVLDILEAMIETDAQQ